jgi:hypothetical protein
VEEKIMKQLGLGIIVAIGLTLPAFADPPQLRSDYVWTYNDTCVVSPSGFSAPPGLAPNGASALGQTYSTSNADTGIEHFNANGTGFVKGGGYAVNLGSPPLPAGANAAGTFSFQFTYVFNSDDTFTMTTITGISSCLMRPDISSVWPTECSGSVRYRKMPSHTR